MDLSNDAMMNLFVGWVNYLGHHWAIIGIVVVAFLGIRYARRWPRKREDNGIRVGPAKIYDNRSLSLMLDELQNQLYALQNIDSGSLAGAIGTQQAERRASRESSVSLTSSPEGAIGSATSENVGKASSEGTSVQPSPLKWSERATDLLRDQVNLSYQIFNLRLLLERAISDRVSEESSQALVQTVIAFPVSIDPPWFAIGCAGTVEVELTLKKDPQNLRQKLRPSQAPSLVALFPQEETYNTWSVDRRRFRLSGVGSYRGMPAEGSGSAEVELSAIRRQADVVAIERELTAVYGPAEKKPDAALVIAWQFRPSASERGVTAGLRQMLAVVSLPECDEAASIITMNMRVRSFWECWDSRSGLGWRALLSKRPTGHKFGDTQTIEVCTTKMLENLLEPKIQTISWYRVGKELATVVVNGKNFFTGTTVTMGDWVFTAENAVSLAKPPPGRVTIKSAQTLEIDAPQTALLYDALLSGRYGPSQPLQVKCPVEKLNLKISKATIELQTWNQSYKVVVEFALTGEPALKGDEWWGQFNKLPEPIFAINGEVVPDVLRFHRTKEDPKNDNPAVSMVAEVSVSSKLIPDSPLLVVRWPFYGKDWRLEYQTSFCRVSISAFRSGSGAQTTVLLSGRNFSDEVMVIADKFYKNGPPGPLSRFPTNLLKLEIASAIVESNPEFSVVLEAGTPSIAIRVPPTTGTSAPRIDISKPPVLNVNAYNQL